MNNIEKAREIQNESEYYVLMSRSSAVLWAAKEMAKWKDEQQKENMLKFMKWIEKRGFIKEDLCYDTEHQVETFIDQILPQLYKETNE